MTIYNNVGLLELELGSLSLVLFVVFMDDQFETHQMGTFNSAFMLSLTS